MIPQIVITSATSPRSTGSATPMPRLISTPPIPASHRATASPPSQVTVTSWSPKAWTS